MIIEFALITPFLMILLAGTFTIGMSLNRSIQASNLCRNANVLIVRGVNLMTPENQNMLIRSASGMGFNLAGTNLPDPNGKGAVYVTKVVRVGSNECYAGISTWNGNASTCANFDEYVIAQRVKIANTSRWSSALGSVSTQTLSDGSLYDSDIAINTGVRASGFSKTTSGSGIIYLNQGEFAYICEVFADVSELNMLPWLAAPSIAVRNVS
ncbi:TadE/TadG family type IV pilus assembly protein [Bryobacter aggregatus]|uniref:TadE/TadG family type IV pilus assembly protein n=1 Tax=Bryobacter aggregatus TaxID=360054 RepID=UPI00138DFD3C|nr:TadE family protein [Bryobacter aggregatus]